MIEPAIKLAAHTFKVSNAFFNTLKSEKETLEKWESTKKSSLKMLVLYL